MALGARDLYLKWLRTLTLAFEVLSSIPHLLPLSLPNITCINRKKEEKRIVALRLRILVGYDLEFIFHNHKEALVLVIPITCAS